MKSCNGCKYLVRTSMADLCRHDDPAPRWEKNQHTGRETYVFTGYMRPTVQKMRSPGANCGPDAVLYDPTLFRRILMKVIGK